MNTPIIGKVSTKIKINPARHAAKARNRDLGLSVIRYPVICIVNRPTASVAIAMEARWDHALMSKTYWTKKPAATATAINRAATGVVLNKLPTTNAEEKNRQIWKDAR